MKNVLLVALYTVKYSNIDKSQYTDCFKSLHPIKKNDIYLKKEDTVIETEVKYVLKIIKF